MAYSFQPLGGGAPPAPSIAGRSMAPQGAGRSTGWRVDGTTSSASRMAGEVEHPSTRQPALRSTYVDADEAAMKRALARIDGDGASRRAGNAFSRTNRSRIQSRLDSFGSTFSATKPLEEQRAKSAVAAALAEQLQRDLRKKDLELGQQKGYLEEHSVVVPVMKIFGMFFFLNPYLKCASAYVFTFS